MRPMASLPAGFPSRVSDEELSTTLDAMIEEIQGLGDFRGHQPALKLALLQAGLQEQSRREAARSLKVALIALAIAALTLIATVIFALVR